MRRRAIGLIAVLLGVGGAGGTATATPIGQAAPAANINGSFDVGGHKLFLTCWGSGSPTVIYLHDYGFETSYGTVGAGEVPVLVQKRHRFCFYDRFNAGHSDKVAGPITTKMTITSLHTLLRVAGVKPPYVLLGSAFGGLLAYVYAATYHKDVKGMLLLDANFPGEQKLMHLFPAKDRPDHDDWKDSAEKLDVADVYEVAAKLEKRTKLAIPVTYLLPTPSEWDQGPARYRAVIFDRIAQYVAGFSPGELKRVKSPHFMEPAVPKRVAREVDLLVAKTR